MKMPSTGMSRIFSTRSRASSGSGLVDLTAALVLVGIVLSFVLVDLQRRRESARSVSCQNNLRNMGIAITNYHRAYQHFPVHGSGTHNESSADADEGDAGTTGSGGLGGGNNGQSLSFIVGILPHLDQQTLWETISQPSAMTVTGKLKDGSYWNAMGPATSQRAYPPWITDLSVLRCPSDPRKSKTTGRTNYAACLGDGLDFQMDSAVRFDKESGSWKLDPLARKRVDAAARGAFVFRETMKLSDITDGLSNTILVGEIATSQGDRDCRTSPALELGAQTSEVPVQGGIFDNARQSDQFINYQSPQFWADADSNRAPKLPMRADEFRGMRWADAHTVFSGFNTILYPNGALQVAGKDIQGPAVAPASSFHPGGAHFLFADGSIQFITDAIDSGNVWSGTVRLGMQGQLEPGSPSPFGIWGSFGTRASNDNK